MWPHLRPAISLDDFVEQHITQVCSTIGSIGFMFNNVDDDGVIIIGGDDDIDNGDDGIDNGDGIVFVDP
jgi:hypothetical protein